MPFTSSSNPQGSRYELRGRLLPRRGLWTAHSVGEQGSAFFFFGVILVLIKFAVIGMLVESVGLFFLFSGFIPKIILFMRSVPVVSAIFYLPFVDTIAQKLSGSTLPV